MVSTKFLLKLNVIDFMLGVALIGLHTYNMILGAEGYTLCINIIFTLLGVALFLNSLRNIFYFRQKKSGTVFTYMCFKKCTLVDGEVYYGGSLDGKKGIGEED